MSEKVRNRPSFLFQNGSKVPGLNKTKNTVIITTLKCIIGQTFDCI